LIVYSGSFGLSTVNKIRGKKWARQINL
jgi:hypothetical protein